MGFAADTQGFDGRALGDRPPRVDVPTGATPAADSGPSAVGRPALAQTADGTASPRTPVRTLQAGDSRPQSSSGKRTRANVDSFNDSTV